MQNAPIPATGEAMPKLDRGSIMQRAWRIYRSRRPVGRFLMICWREALRNAWGMWRLERDEVRPAASRPQRVLSPLEAAIDTTKYLPARMSQAREIERIRAEFAARTAPAARPVPHAAAL